jgi:2-phospho-L-lactate transferase/gluconeogenesis factor (CofD/UPF0052 family)
MLVLNLVPQEGETDGYTAADHVEVLAAHAPALRLDAVVVDPSSIRGDEEARQLAKAAASLGAQVHTAQVAADGGLPYHDPERLAAVLGSILG